ncbi:MAG TPA: hypothetical protein ENI86_11640 [Acidimicrobiales bacterium]|nr:hypothetical protein [Acidimicrobiales bacterium]
MRCSSPGRRLAVLVSAAAVLATACAGGAAIESESGPVAAAGPESMAEFLARRPAERFLFDYGEASGINDSRSRAVDRCMRDAGFDSDQRAYDAESMGLGEEVLLGDPAVVGFGVSTVYDSVGERMLTDTGLFPAGRRTYWESLTPDERDRYLSVYLGSGGQPGCAEKGLPPESGVGLTAGLDDINELNEAWAALLTDPDSDPAVVEERERWSRCMADRGFDYNEPRDAYDDVRRRLQDLVDQYRDPQAGPAEAIPRPEQIPPEAFDTPDPELSALQRYETEVAVASTECGVRPGRDVNAYEEQLTSRELDLLRERQDTLAPIAEAVGLDLDDYLGPVVATSP